MRNRNQYFESHRRRGLAVVFLTILALLISATINISFAQNIRTDGAVNALMRDFGSRSVDKVFVLPFTDTATANTEMALYPTSRKKGATIVLNDSTMAYYTDRWRLVSIKSSSLPGITIGSTNQNLVWGNDYVFNGATASYVLPSVSGSLIGRNYAITVKNRGSGNITVSTTDGLNVLYGTALVNTFIIPPGNAYTFVSDGQIINIQ